MSFFASTSLIKNYGIRNRIARADRQFNICHSYGTGFIFSETEDNYNLQEKTSEVVLDIGELVLKME